MSKIRSLPEDIQKAMNGAEFREGTTRAQVLAAAKQLGVTFPEDFIELLVETNGASFRLGDSHAELYDTDRIIEENADPEDGFPAHLKVFGDNGGAEKFAFDSRTAPHPLVVVPHYQPKDEDVLPQGTTLTTFLGRMMRNELFG